MKASARFIGWAGLVLLLAGVAAPVFGAECAPLKLTEGPRTPRLESNEYFEVVSPTKVTFRPGVVFEAVKTSDGRSLLRFNFESLVIGDPVPAPALECRCDYPSVCTRNSCKATPSGGSATCDGGCYRADGTACVSCQFYKVVPQPQ
ncbi:MAG: hypothetical protein ABUT39_02605 [Acidobacteriota bacterium]